MPSGGSGNGEALVKDIRILRICIILYVTSIILSTGVSYLPPWIMLRLSPSLRLVTRPLAEALLLTYMLSLSAGSVISGVLLNLAMYRRRLIIVGGLGIAATSVLMISLPNLGFISAIMCWALLGFFTSLALFGLSYILKSSINAWSRGKTFAIGFAAGAFLDALSMHIMGIDRFMLILQATLAFTSTLLILRILGKGETGNNIFDSVHVRDFRLYLFMIPTIIVAVFIGHLLRGFIFSGLVYMVFSTLRYSPLLALPMLLSIVAGHVMDKYGRREAGAIGSIMLSAGIVVLLVHHLSGVLEKSNGLSMTSFLIIGAGISFVIPYLIISWIDVPRRDLFGRVFTLGMLTFTAGVIAGVLATAVSDNVDSTLTAITLSLIPLVYVILKLPETLPRERLLHEDLRRYLRKALEIAEGR